MHRRRSAGERRVEGLDRRQHRRRPRAGERCVRGTRRQRRRRPSDGGGLYGDRQAADGRAEGFERNLPCRTRSRRHVECPSSPTVGRRDSSATATCRGGAAAAPLQLPAAASGGCAAGRSEVYLAAFRRSWVLPAPWSVSARDPVRRGRGRRDGSVPRAVRASTGCRSDGAARRVPAVRNGSRPDFR